MLVYFVLDMVRHIGCDMMVYKREVRHSLMRVVLLSGVNCTKHVRVYVSAQKGY